MVEFATITAEKPPDRMPIVLLLTTRLFWIVTLADPVLLAPSAAMPVPLLTSWTAFKIPVLVAKL